MTIRVLPPVAGSYGEVLADAGDLDGDNVHDLLVGAPGDGTKGLDAGAIRIFSGRDGELLLQAYGEASGDQFGFAVARAGDMDGDGLDDYVVGGPYSDQAANNAGRIWVIAGRDGRTLLAVNGPKAGDLFGFSVGALRNLARDALPELLAGAPKADGTGAADTGKVTVLSGQTGQLVFEVLGDLAGQQLGWSVAGIGDVDGDSQADFAVSAPAFPLSPTQGFTRILSGSDGHTLVDMVSTLPFAGGASTAVHAAGDFDRDGTTDVLLVHRGGFVQVNSGATGAELFRQVWLGPMYTAQSGDVIGDVDGDGIDEVVVGSMGIWAGEAPGHAYVYPGADGGKLLFTFWPVGYGHTFGAQVASLGDVDGDDLTDFAVGSTDTGTVPGIYVFSCAPSPWIKHYVFQGGPWWPGPIIEPLGSLQPGSPLQLLLLNVPPGVPALLVLGARHADLPFMGGVMHPEPDWVIPAGMTDLAGQFVLHGRWPGGVASGQSLTVQWWIVDPSVPSGFLGSDGATGTTP